MRLHCARLRDCYILDIHANDYGFNDSTDYGFKVVRVKGLQFKVYRVREPLWQLRVLQQLHVARSEPTSRVLSSCDQGNIDNLLSPCSNEFDSWFIMIP